MKDGRQDPGSPVFTVLDAGAQHLGPAPPSVSEWSDYNGYDRCHELRDTR